MVDVSLAGGVHNNTATVSATNSNSGESNVNVTVDGPGSDLQITNADATFDDITGAGDEDGVAFSAPGGQSIVADVVVTVRGSEPVTLRGWLDVRRKVGLPMVFLVPPKVCFSRLIQLIAQTWVVTHSIAKCSGIACQQAGNTPPLHGSG